MKSHANGKARHFLGRAFQKMFQFQINSITRNRSRISRSAEEFLELKRKLFVAGKASIIHCQDLANSANSQLGRASQAQNQIIGVEVFQVTNRMDVKKHEGFFGLQVILKDNIQWSINRNSRPPQLSDRLRIPNA